MTQAPERRFRTLLLAFRDDDERNAHCRSRDDASPPGAHIIAARAVLFHFATSAAFSDLMRATLDNAAALAQGLRAGGVRLNAGGTDTHMVIADLRDTDWSAKDLNEQLLRYNIVASVSSLPRRSTSAKRLGLRLGSVAMTICGADRDAFVCIGAAVAKIIKTRSALVDPDLARNLREIADAYPPPVD